MSNNKLLRQTTTLGIGILLAALTSVAAITTIQQQQTTIVPVAYATSMGGGEEEDCSRVPASDPDLEGWTIETCGNGEQTWISPSGKRCVANEASGTTGCEGSPPINVQ